MQSAMDSTASNFSGTTAPTPKFVGQQYYDTANKKLYICTAIADDGTGTWTDIFSDMIAAAKKEALSEAHPVGSYYFSDKSTNPGTLFGGTWEAVAPGHTLVAQGTATAEDGSTLTFTAGNKYGEFKHQLTVGELASHDGHLYDLSEIKGHGDKAYLNWLSDALTSADTGYGFVNYSTSSGLRPTYPTGKSLGGNKYHNNLSACIAVYCWRRTA